MASSIGGSLAGRLRTKWVGVHTHEVFFRDTAHGFLAWAFATVLSVAVLVAKDTGSAISQKIFEALKNMRCSERRLNPNLQFILPYDLPSLAFEQICCLLVRKGGLSWGVWRPRLTKWIS
jgi:hypothetical protein